MIQPMSFARSLALVCMVFPGIALSACRSADEPLPPVFGAVFGLSGAATTPYSVGKIPDPAVQPSDTLVGAAANSPGLCIWRDHSDRRFRANCPEGYAP